VTANLLYILFISLLSFNNLLLNTCTPVQVEILLILDAFIIPKLGDWSVANKCFTQVQFPDKVWDRCKREPLNLGYN